MPSVFVDFIQDSTLYLNEPDIDKAQAQVEQIFQSCIYALEIVGRMLGGNVFPNQSLQEVNQVLHLIRDIFDKFAEIGIEDNIAREVKRVRKPFLIGAIAQIKAASAIYPITLQDEDKWVKYQGNYQQCLLDCNEYIVEINRNLKGWKP